MPKQSSKKPTAKLLAASLTTFVVALMVAWLANFGVDLPPSTVEFVTSMVQPIILSGATFVVGYLWPPSPRDQITE